MKKPEAATKVINELVNLSSNKNIKTDLTILKSHNDPIINNMLKDDEASSDEGDSDIDEDEEDGEGHLSL